MPQLCMLAYVGHLLAPRLADVEAMFRQVDLASHVSKHKNSGFQTSTGPLQQSCATDCFGTDFQN